MNNSAVHEYADREAGGRTIQTGKLAINLDKRAVTIEGHPVRLTAKEYQILELLSLRKGITVTKEMFLNHLYDENTSRNSKIIDVFVCNLRKKLAQATGGNHYIETVWGRGYVLRDPATRSAITAPGMAGRVTEQRNEPM